MYKNSHEKRESMQEMNKNDNVIFKVDDDPQLLNVLKEVCHL